MFFLTGSKLVFLYNKKITTFNEINESEFMVRKEKNRCIMANILGLILLQTPNKGIYFHKTLKVKNWSFFI